MCSWRPEKNTPDERWKFRGIWSTGGYPSPRHFLHKVFHRETLELDLRAPDGALKSRCPAMPGRVASISSLNHESSSAGLSA
jgi:hypothetical protein